MQVWYLGLEIGNLSQLNIFLQESAGFDAKSVSPTVSSSGEKWTKGAPRSHVWPVVNSDSTTGVESRVRPGQRTGPAAATLSAEAHQMQDQPAEDLGLRH